MNSLYDVPAPAKLNLFLHVVGRREDGYHLLQSVFMLIDWHDTLHFERRPGEALSREDIGEPVPADDLVLRAARALQSATGCGQGAHITLDKRLPAQAGMGGGSSDAASCLLALNRLWNTGLDLPELARIGVALGADVPFFLHGRNAWVEGIGERIAPVDLPSSRFLVAKPPAGLDTAAIFRAPDLRRDSGAAIISGFAANPLQFGRNDLQPVAQRLCPDVGLALEWLASQGLAGRMTGSGSAVFAPLPPGHQVPPAPPGWLVRECSNMDVHPLAGWASSDSSSVGR
ncbi:4-(cytidine 5'-diphospho)-2-C-methyl-D-erythritol kinase [Ramlibacter tataouinensis]|uniref:4-(cytidine 5'-diphospho)-2-C-methyl-D-erythritol kinase n=1 Tax=Ramlibacter tataouinensis TaxID=94132 RepID=UPI0022F390FB|nr:4-(cytidine 5'-diphospho)-2-C-methyl-D-erythritol kinase [Ramlibacter tataouinensis]WBY00504.1 4-(cytidine 5'-diphospho)-2-C-methyl-D-erythritol kinase [Ramlibacter tataouinensis]